MEAERPPAPGPGCRHPSPRAAGPEPAAAPVSVLAPPQGPPVGGDLAGLEFAPPQDPEPRAPGTRAGAAAGPPTPSAHIPVPAHRAPQGKARLDEVMAAAALTSLSTSPLLLGPPAAAFSTGQRSEFRGLTAEQPETAGVRTLAWHVPAEPSLEPWSETLVQPPGSYGSSGSGDWGWDPVSEQSSPSTPSPPLTLEAAHFLFGEPAPRKRKSAVQVLFQCLWKRCGKVLSTASGMQRHIRLAHLGRQAEPEQSDGEEDFYYTELDIGLEMLTDGLSSLTPMSPTASPPPPFPHLELPEPPALSSLLHPLDLSPPQVLSSAVPPQVCHSDHSYQGCLAPNRLQPQPSTVRACVPALPSKLGANLRKPRGDAKKCRKVYGMEHRDLWCTACRWKKACQRFLD